MNSTKTDPNAGPHSVDGRLHLIHHVRDEAGNRITTVTGPLKVEFRIEDLAQLVAGACVMALPVALTEEVWNLGGTISWFSALTLWALTGLVIILVVLQNRFDSIGVQSFGAAKLTQGLSLRPIAT